MQQANKNKVSRIIKVIGEESKVFKWGPIEAKPIYPGFFDEVLFRRKYWTDKWTWPNALAIYNNGRLIYIINNHELCSVGLKYFKKYFLKIDNFNKQWQKWEEWVIRYNKFFSDFPGNFKKISDKEFEKLYETFYFLNVDFWLIVHVPEIANWGGEYLLKNKLKKIDRKNCEQYLEILSAPIKLSFFQEEEINLYKILIDSKKAGINLRLKEHAEKYFWILNSYAGNRVLGVKYYRDRLKDIENTKIARTKINKIKIILQNNKKRKNDLIKKLKLGKEIKVIGDMLSESVWWQDLRKGYIWRMQYLFDLVLKEISKRKKWKFSDLQWCMPSEILDILNNKKIDKKKINLRKKGFTIFTNNNKINLFLDKELNDELFNFYNKISLDTKIDIIKGLVVSRGKKVIKGNVKIIRNPFKDSKKLKSGDILVASMTSPEFIIAMKKASAIITDQGGMTSHAAIVSRELGILCIVGTKIATQVLKDGDRVEVDANHGTIKIIDKY